MGKKGTEDGDGGWKTKRHENGVGGKGGGINTRRMKADDMRVVLSNHEDFRTEKTIVEHYLVNRRHLVHFIPKFHCELNPIERVWGQAKVYTRMRKNFTLVRLRQIVGPTLHSVQADLIRSTSGGLMSMKGHT